MLLTEKDRTAPDGTQTEVPEYNGCPAEGIPEQLEKQREKTREEKK